MGIIAERCYMSYLCPNYVLFMSYLCRICQSDRESMYIYGTHSPPSLSRSLGRSGWKVIWRVSLRLFQQELAYLPFNIILGR